MIPVVHHFYEHSLFVPASDRLCMYSLGMVYLLISQSFLLSNYSAHRNHRETKMVLESFSKQQVLSEGSISNGELSSRSAPNSRPPSILDSASSRQSLRPSSMQAEENASTTPSQNSTASEPTIVPGPSAQLVRRQPNNSATHEIQCLISTLLRSIENLEKLITATTGNDLLDLTIQARQRNC